MAKIKIKFRASSVGIKEGTLYFQVIHKRVARQIHTEYKLYPSEWDAVHSDIIMPPYTAPQRYSYLQSLRDTLKADKKKLQSVIARLEKETQTYTADKVVEYYREGKVLQGFIAYTAELSNRLHSIGKTRMADRYTTTVNSLRRYLNGNDIPIEEMDGTLMQGYEQWLKEQGLCRNTTSFYMRNLRTIYNHAVEDTDTVSSNPFKHVYTGIDKTVKRAIPMETIRQLKQLDLSLNPRMDFARDMFLFSFYTRGMSFIDMVNLRKKDLKGGILSYHRQKTSQLLHIKWEAPMQEIVAKYPTGNSSYLLPIACDINNNIDHKFMRIYKNAYNRINKQLKKLGEMLGLPIPLTTYVARHAWASIAKSENIPISTISEALGHDSEKTTMIYLASLDSSGVDKANNLIISLI